MEFLGSIAGGILVDLLPLFESVVLLDTTMDDEFDTGFEYVVVLRPFRRSSRIVTAWEQR